MNSKIRTLESRIVLDATAGDIIEWGLEDSSPINNQNTAPIDDQSLDFSDYMALYNHLLSIQEILPQYFQTELLFSSLDSVQFIYLRHITGKPYGDVVHSLTLAGCTIGMGVSDFYSSYITSDVIDVAEKTFESKNHSLNFCPANDIRQPKTDQSYLMKSYKLAPVTQTPLANDTSQIIESELFLIDNAMQNISACPVAINTTNKATETYPFLIGELNQTTVGKSSLLDKPAQKHKSESTSLSKDVSIKTINKETNKQSHTKTKRAYNPSFAFSLVKNFLLPLVQDVLNTKPLS